MTHNPQTSHSNHRALQGTIREQSSKSEVKPFHNWPPERMPYSIKKKPQPEGIIIKVGPDNTFIIEEMDQGSPSKIEPIGRMPYSIKKKPQPEGIIIKVGPDNTFIIEEMPPERF